MKKKISIFAGFLAFILLLAGASLLYRKLSNQAAPNNLMTEQPAAETEKSTEKTTETETAAENSQNTEPAETESETDAAQIAPDFTVLDQEGNEVHLSDYKGTPVIVNFWASWCPPCKREMPDFQRAYETYGDQVQFMMVNLTDGSRETTELATAHIQKNSYTFPVFFDTESSAAKAYVTSSIPASYFIDKEGALTAYAVGMIDSASLEQGIQMILP